MKLMRYILTLIVALTALHATAQSADRIIRDAADKLIAAGTVEAAFTVNGGEGPISGMATIAGPQFVLDTPILAVWYDGTTQWTLLKSSDEVSITEPTADELMESNPFALLCNYSTAYSARRLPDVSGHKRVELTPLDTSDTDITHAVIHVASDGWPAAAEIHFPGNRTISAMVNRIGAVAAKPQNFYKFDSNRHPATVIVDLR